MNITNCPACGLCYEESSEEEANSPNRLCRTCYKEAQSIIEEQEHNYNRMIGESLKRY